MSKLHLEAFLKDVKGIHPDFRVETSSLKGLVRHLEANLAKPVQMSEQAALQHCAKFGAGRIDKYLPAIKRLVGVWGQPSRPYPQAAHGNALSVVELNRVCFRGDSRPPAEIFAKGFTKDPGVSATYRGGKVAPAIGAPNPVIDKIIGLKKAGDLDPASAVCVTPDMHVAALFPLPVISVLKNFQPTEQATWIYMVYVEKGSHTHGRQVLDSLDGLDALREITPQQVGQFSAAQVTAARVDEILQNLYGREMATNAIAPTAIWYGFKIMRSWTKTMQRTSWTDQGKIVGFEGDYKEGGTYKILEAQKNTAALYPPGRTEHWKQVASELAADLTKDGGQTFRLPTHKSGFVPSHLSTLI